MKHLPPLPVLQAFEAAARLGSFSRAATERSLTPGAVSRHIQALEHWCGHTLFTRNGPQVTLTRDGEALRQRLGEPMQALYDALLPAVETARETPLSLFTLPSIAESLILPHLADFHDHHPHIHLSLLT
ncbi:MAG: LysR family transcriptional regulator [Asticcacaulis sp.]|nr:LysR family transcriptional regulator [Asticcacaulis sp.]